MKPPRFPLYGFPDVVLHAPESTTKGHPEYAAAKGGDAEAARLLVTELVSSAAMEQIAGMFDGRAVELVPIHALETAGVNQIPAAFANVLSRKLRGLPVNKSIVQLNAVGHTGADGFRRLANQALFSGTVVPGQSYVVVDDFVGQGGTLANLIGLIRVNPFPGRPCIGDYGLDG